MKYAAVLLFLILLIFPSFAKAQKISVNPENIRLGVRAGDSTSSTLEITNLSDNELTVGVYPAYIPTSTQSPYFSENSSIYTFIAEFSLDFEQRYKAHIVQYSLTEQTIIDTLYSENLQNVDVLSEAIAYHNNELYFWTFNNPNQIKVLDILSKQIDRVIELPENLYISSLSHSGRSIYAMAKKSLYIHDPQTIYEIDAESGLILRTLEEDAIRGSIAVNKKDGFIYKVPFDYPFNKIVHKRLNSSFWSSNFFTDADITFSYITYDQPSNTLILYGNKGYYKTRSLFFVDATTRELKKEIVVRQNAGDYDEFSGLAANESGLPYFFDWISSEKIAIPASSSSTFEFQQSAKHLFTGSYQTDLEVYIDDEIFPTSSIPLLLDVNGNPEIKTQSLELNFDDVIVGNTKSKNLIVYNTGSEELIISNISFTSSSYGLKEQIPFPLIIPPTDSTDLHIFFSPEIEGQSSASLTFSTNDETDPTLQISLSGNSVPPPSITITPPSIDVSLFSNELSSKSISVTNSGNSPLYYQVTGFGDPAYLTTGSRVYPLYVAASNWNDRNEVYEASIYTYSLEQKAYIDTLNLAHLGDLNIGRFAYSNGNFYIKDYKKGLILIVDAVTGKVIRKLNNLIINDISVQIESHNGSKLLLSRIQYGEKVELYRIDEQTGVITDSLIFTEFPGVFPTDFSENIADSVIYAMENRSIYAIDLKKNAPLQFEEIQYLSDYSITKFNYSAPDNSFIFYNDNYNTNRDEILVYNLSTEKFTSFPTAFSFAYSDVATVETTIPTYLELKSTVYDTVKASETSEFNVDINAQNLIGGTYNSTLIFESNDPDKPRTEVPINLQVTGSPIIKTKTDTLNFDQLIIGDERTLSITLYNTGTEDLNITGFNFSSDQFSFSDSVITTAEIAPSDSLTFNLGYTPTESTSLSETIEIPNNSDNAPNLSLTLLGSAITPASLSVSKETFQYSPTFNEVLYDSLVLTNSGEENLEFHIEILQQNPEYSVFQKEFFYTIKTIKDYTLDEYFNYVLKYSTDEYAPVDTLYKGTRGNVRGIALYNNKLYISDATYPSQIMVVDVTTKQLEPPVQLPYDISFLSLAHTGDYLIGSRKWYNDVTVFKIALNGSVNVDTLFFESDSDLTGHVTVNVKKGVFYSSDTHGNIFEQSLNLADTLKSPLVQLPDVRLYSMSYSSISNSLFVNTSYKVLELDAFTGNLKRTLDNNASFSYGIAFNEYSSIQPLSFKNALSGTLSQNESATIKYTINSVGVLEGEYAIDFIIQSNDRITPTTKISGTTSIAGIPKLTASADSLHFESIFTGQSTTMPVSVSNSGTKTLNINSVVVDDDVFFIKDYNGEQITLQPLEYKMFEVVFLPNEERLYTSTLKIISDSDTDSSKSQIYLVAEALEAPKISVLEDELVLTVNPQDSIIKTSIHLENSGGSDLVYSIHETRTDSIGDPIPDFYSLERVYNPTSGNYNVRLAGYSWKTGGVINSNLVDPGNIDSFTRSGNKFYFTSRDHYNRIYYTTVGDFTPSEAQIITINSTKPLEINNITTHPRGLLVSTKQRYTESYQLLLVSTVNGSILDTIHTSSEKVFYDISYDAKKDIIYQGFDSYSGTTGEYLASVNPSGLVSRLQTFFDPADSALVTYSGRSQISYNTFYHINLDDLSISDSISTNYTDVYEISTDALFPYNFIKVPKSPPVVPEQETIEVPIYIDTQNLIAGSYHSQLEIESNVTDVPSITIPVTIKVNGSAELTMQDSLFQFGEVVSGVQETSEIELTNVGSADLVIQNFSITNPVFGLPDTTSAYIIPPNNSMLFPLSYLPPEVGSFAGNFTFTSNSTSKKVHTLPLFGTATLGPRLSLELEPASFELTYGDTKTSRLTLKNIGSSKLEMELSARNIFDYDSMFQNVVLDPAKNILVVQDDATWQSGMFILLSTEWFPDLNFTHIESSQLATTNITNYDLIYFVSGRYVEFFTNLNSNKQKIEEYVQNGGTIFMNLPVIRQTVELPGEIKAVSYYSNQELKYGPQFNHSTLIDSTLLEIVSSNTGFINVPDYVSTIVTVNEYPTVIEYPFQKGQVFATSWELENYLSGSNQNVHLINLFKNIFTYVLNLDFYPDWITFSEDYFEIEPGDSVSTSISIDATNLSVGNYKAQLVTHSNIPSEKYFTNQSQLTLNVSDILSLGENNLLPTTYELTQNYPNPFNPSTNISYALPDPGSVKIVIWNVLGQNVSTLVNEAKMPGYYSVTFNASQLSSGMYFYSLFIDDEVMFTKKMLLLK